MNLQRLHVFYAGLDPSTGGIACSARIFHDYATQPSKYAAWQYGQNDDDSVEYQTNSKLQILWKVYRKNWRFKQVLFWHLGLTQLRIAMRQIPDQTILFGHGIELWRHHSRRTTESLRRVDLFLHNSHYTLMRARQYLVHPLKNVCCVPLGIGHVIDDVSLPDFSKPSAVILARISISENYKGHVELIRAWPGVLRQLPKANLHILGTGDLVPELQSLVTSLHLEHAIHFMGRVDEETKQRQLRESTCFLMPSRGEGFGLVYLEAMRLGRPCLVSDEDAGQEVVNPPECGLAVNVRDEESMVSAIVRLMTPGPEWDQWSRAAKVRYDNNYTALHFQQRMSKALSLQTN